MYKWCEEQTEIWLKVIRDVKYSAETYEEAHAKVEGTHNVTTCHSRTETQNAHSDSDEESGSSCFTSAPNETFTMSALLFILLNY